MALIQQKRLVTQARLKAIDGKMLQKRGDSVGQGANLMCKSIKHKY